MTDAELRDRLDAIAEELADMAERRAPVNWPRVVDLADELQGLAAPRVS